MAGCAGLPFVERQWFDGITCDRHGIHEIMIAFDKWRLYQANQILV